MRSANATLCVMPSAYNYSDRGFESCLQNGRDARECLSKDNQRDLVPEDFDGANRR